MYPVITDDTAAAAVADLSRYDAALAPVIARTGICPIRPHRDYYRELVEAIIGQQLSVKAAASILRRFNDLFDGLFPEPERLQAKSVDELRSAGLSRAKAAYVQDLACHITDGRLAFDRFDSLSNDEISRELTAVKGIGQWTADMFLLFCMARTDVLPVGDLGVRTGMQRLYGLETLPDAAAMRAIAADRHWHPHASIASWYVWQMLDNAPLATAVSDQTA